MAEYQPGVCNINQRESRKRTILGVTMLIPTTLLSWLLLNGFSFITLGLVWATAFVAATGVLQGRQNFCVAHAKNNTFKMTSEGDIEDEDKIKKDYNLANKIILQSFTFATVYAITLVIYL